jgi:hypothetical protein
MTSSDHHVFLPQLYRIYRRHSQLLWLHLLSLPCCICVIVRLPNIFINWMRHMWPVWQRKRDKQLMVIGESTSWNHSSRKMLGSRFRESESSTFDSPYIPNSNAPQQTLDPYSLYALCTRVASASVCWRILEQFREQLIVAGGCHLGMPLRSFQGIGYAWSLPKHQYFSI